MTEDELREDIEKTAAYCREQGQSVEINSSFPWVSIYHGEDEEYFFQGEEASNLLDGVPKYVNEEDYLLWVSQGVVIQWKKIGL